MKKIFIAFPFSSEYDYVETAVRRACDSKATVLCARDQITNQHVFDKVVGQMREADLLIFDLSGRSPNVFLELGFAMGEQLNWRIVYDPSRADDGMETIADLRGRDSGRYDSPDALEQLVRLLIADQRNFQNTSKPKRRTEDCPFLDFKLRTEKVPGQPPMIVAELRNLAAGTVATDVRPYVSGVGHLDLIVTLAGDGSRVVLKSRLDDKIAFREYLKEIRHVIVEYADRYGNYYRQIGILEQHLSETGNSLSADGLGRPEETDANRLLPITIHPARIPLRILDVS